MLTPGRTFAEHYRVVRRLGAGGMGQVYLVENLPLQRLEALKTLDPEKCDQLAARFIREAQAAAKLQHPSIVSIYHVRPDATPPWFTMQYAGGDDLDRTPTRSDREALGVVERLAGALDYAHRRGVVHRDVKPANVIVTRDEAGAIESCCLLDFGIAKLAEVTPLTAAGGVVGTLQFLAPEAWNGEAGPAADQYALACTAYALLGGRSPFSGQVRDLMVAHMMLPPPKLSDVRPEAASASRVLERALAKSPHDRYASCGEFAAALAAARREPSTPVSPPDEDERLPGTVVRFPTPPPAARRTAARSSGYLGPRLTRD